MVFVNKEFLHSEAERLGLDISGMSWPEAQKALFEKQREVDGKVNLPKKAAPAEKQTSIPMPKPAAVSAQEKLLRDIPNMGVVISPGLKPMRYQKFGYNEDLGPDIMTEDISYVEDGYRGQANTSLGGYVVRGSSGRNVVAQSALPKENAEIIFEPATDWFPKAHDPGKNNWGYLFNHHRLPNVKQAFINAGIWDKYHDDFNAEKHPNWIWMVSGKFYVCDIPHVNAIIDRYNAEVRERNGRR